MALNRGKLKQLYAALQKGGYAQDYDTFERGMSGNDNYNNRKQVYDLLTAHGAKIGDTYEDFMGLMQSKPQKQTTAKPVRAQKSAYDPNVPKFLQEPQEETPEWMQQPVKADELPQTIARPRDYTKGGALVEDLKQADERNIAGQRERQGLSKGKYTEADVEGVIRRQEQRQADALDKSAEQLIAQGTKEELDKYEQMPLWQRIFAYSSPNFRATDTQSLLEHISDNSKVQSGRAMQAEVEDAREAMDEAERQRVEDRDTHTLLGHAMNKGARTLRGLWGAARKVRTWDMGEGDMRKAAAIFEAAQAYDNGTATPEQEALMEAAAFGTSMQGKYGDALGGMYGAGSTTTQMLPFILQIAMNPARGVGEAAQKAAIRGTTKFLEKRLGKELAKKWMGKAIGNVAKGAARLTGDAVEALGAQTAYGMPTTLADYYDRMTGTVGSGKDENGNIVYNGMRDGVEHSAGTAFAKAFGNNYLQYQSEMVGEYFAPILKVLNGGSSKLLQKFTPDVVSEFVTGLSNNRLTKLYNDFAKKTKWSGTLGEYAEEVVNNIENAVFIGDMDFSTGENGVFNPKMNWDTFLGVGLFGGVMSGIRTGEYAINRHRLGNLLNDANTEAATMFGEDKWQQMKDAIDTADDKTIGSVLTDAVNGKNQEQAKAIAKYAGLLYARRGENLAEMKNAEEQDEDAPNPLQEAYDKGYAMTEDSDKADVQTNYDLAVEGLQQSFGTDNVDAIFNTVFNENNGQQIGAGLVDRMRESGQYNDAQMQAIDNFMQARATYYGMAQHMNEEMESQVKASNATVRQHTNPDDGMIHEATLFEKNEDNTPKKVYVVKGSVATADDGKTVVASRSSDHITIVDAATGEKKMVSPDALSTLELPMDAEQVRQEAENNIRAEYTQKQNDILNGTVGFNFGDTYTLLDDEGVEKQLQVTADPKTGLVVNPDGTVNMLLDGQIAALPKALVQAMVDNSRRNRLAQQNAAAAQTNQQQVAQNAPQQAVEAAQATVPAYEAGQTVTLTDDEGQSMEVTVQRISEDGVEVFDGKRVAVIPQNEFEAMLAKTASSENSEDTENTENSEATVVGQSEEQPQTARSRVPKDENGNPIYEQAEPDAAWDAIVEETMQNTPDQAKAEQIAQTAVGNMVKAKEAALKRAEKATAKTGTTMAEMIAAEQERQQNIDNAKAELEHWKKIAGEQQRRKDAAEAKAKAEAAKQLTPTEERLAQLDKAKTAQEQLATAKRLYGNTDYGYLLDELEPQTVEELVANNLGAHTLNWEGVNGKRGLQQELGLKRGIGRNYDTNAVNYFIAPKGQGLSVDEAAHAIWEARPESLENVTTEDIKNAMLDMLATAGKATDISRMTLNNRIAQIEQYLQGEEAANEEHARQEAEAAEQQAAYQEYMDYLESVAQELLAEEDADRIRGIIADEMADMEAEEALMREAALQGSADYEQQIRNNESDNQQSVSEGQGVDNEPEPGAVQGGTSRSQTAVRAEEPSQQQADAENQERPQSDTRAARVAAGTGHADGGVSVPGEGDGTVNAAESSANQQGRKRNLLKSLRRGGISVSLQLKQKDNGRQEETADGNHDGQPENNGSGVVGNTARSVSPLTDRGVVQVYGEEMAALRSEHLSSSERNRRGATSERLVELSKKDGTYIPVADTKSLGDRLPKSTGESTVYINTDKGKVYKVKDPYAKAAMKNGVEPEDAIFEHLVHNLLFPETRYTLEGISDVMGDVRIVLSQDYIKSVGRATQKQIEEELAKRGLVNDGKYSYGNEYVSVTDVEGDNVLIGEDGTLYFIDPIINFKKPLKDVLDGLSSKNTAQRVGEASLEEAIENTIFSLPIHGEGQMRMRLEMDYPAEMVDKIMDEAKKRLEQQSPQAKVEAAEQEVDTHPTEAQKEAGNYKKGHVEVAGFDITIENPKDSVRSGTDASGKKWSVTMHNTYGYIRGTEGVDGDHIDVFLADDLDKWDGGKVYVVDQYNPDGSFDEHKVMVGFNNGQDAYAAYLSNYEKGWENGRKLHVSEVSMDDFKKWIDSSHRKTKPFEEYKSVPSNSTQEPMTNELPKQGHWYGTPEEMPDYDKMSRSQKRTLLHDAADAYSKGYHAATDDNDFFGGRQNEMTYEDFFNAYREEHGFFGIKHDGPFLPALYEHLKGKLEKAVETRREVRTAAPVESQQQAAPIEQPKRNYTVEPAQYTTKRGKVLDMQLVKFDFLQASQQKAAASLARSLKGWWDKSQKGFMLRNEEDVKTFVDAVNEESGETLADHAPLSLADLKESTPQSASEEESQSEKKEDVFQQAERIAKEEGERLEKQSMAARIGDWLSKENLSQAYGKTRDEIFEEFGNELEPIASVPAKYLSLISPNVSDPHIYCGKGYFIDHALRNHGKAEHQVTPEEVDASQYLNMQSVLDNPDSIKETTVDGKRTVVFIKKIGRYYAELTQAEEDGKIVLHKSLFNQKKEPYAKLNDIRQKESSSEGGASSISHADNSAPAISLQSRGDEVSSETPEQKSLLNRPNSDQYPTAREVSADKVTANSDTKQENSEKKEQTKQEEKPKNPSGNKLVTDERYEELKKRMREKLRGQMNMGIDPEILAIGTEMAVYHIEKGARKFADYAKGMIADLGDAIRPYLKAFYEGTKNMPEIEENGWYDEMTPSDEVRKFDVANFDKPTVSAIATAETVAKEQEVAKQAEEGKEKLVAERNKKRKKSVSSQQPSLFDDLNTNDNEQVHIQNGGPAAEREERPEHRQNEPLGESQRNEVERTDGQRMGGRSSEHPVPERERGGRVSGLSESEERLTQPKNARNNHGERGVEYAPKSVDARIEANIKAIELAQQLLENGETATPQQMAVLRKFSGWGGLGKAFDTPVYGHDESPLNPAARLQSLLGKEAYEQAAMSANSSFYTPTAVIDSLWDIARKVGFKGGKVLEGSAGIGNILAQMPTDMSERSDIEAVEIDPTAGGILSLLYPDAKVQIQGFEQTKVRNNSVDLAITNVPFVTGLRVSDNTGDQDLAKKFHDIHDFCIAKNVRKLREGGIGIFITSSGTLDSSQKLRNWLVSEGNADVVGAFRLNNKTFGSATAVTSDIIVVRKRANGKPSAHAIDVSTVGVERTSTYHYKGVVWRGGRSVMDEEEKPVAMDYNRYFMEHPEMMAGEMAFGFEKGDTYRPTSKGLYQAKGKEQEKMLQAFVESLSDLSDNSEVSEHSDTMPDRYAELGESVKEGSMVVSDGKLCIAQGGKAVPLAVNANKVKGHSKVECFEAYSAIKDAVNAVLDYQTLNADDAGLKPLLKKLNKAYDDFVKTYGHLHENTAISFLKNDIEFPSIAALEKFTETGDEKGNRVQTFEKTDIFNRRVVEKASEPHPTNVKDGVVVSIQQHGRIDVPYIAEQLGKSEDEVVREIVKEGLGFEDPVSGEVEVSFKYKSGNVREKLRQAQEANEDGRYNANIKALESVIPMNIPAHLIEFTLGSSWVSPKLYEDYVKDRTDISVKLVLAGGNWSMKEPYQVRNEKNKAMGVYSEMLHKTIYGHELIEAAIQNKTISVQETHKLPGGKKETIVDKDATAACAAKIDEIRQDFKDWARQKMQADPALSEEIERTYNEQFNNYALLEIPDEFVPKYFEGASHRFDLRPHQGKAAVRATMQPLMLAHEVGTGKTFTLITTAMEMRRLGTAKKPMIVVQNATVAQFVADAKALYPNAKVLTLSDKDRKREGRQDFYAKIRYNDWDMIVIPQSTLEMIPDSEERQRAFVQDKIEEKLLVLQQLRESGDVEDYIIKRAERELENLQDELANIGREETAPGKVKGKKGKDLKREAKTKQNAEVKAREMLDRKTDDTLNFDDMGIDALLVDEAHEYKHLGFATAMQRGVKGIDPSYSKKSQGVYLKCQAVLDKSHGKNVVFATGTPISNTAAEVWTFMRYLMPADTMKEYGIYYFDDFVRNFGNLQQMLEFNTNGKFKEVNRFSGYTNLPELQRIWLSVADTVKTEDNKELQDKIPEMESGKAQDLYLPQTKALRSVMKYVKERLEDYEKMSGKEKKANSHIPLTMYGIAKAAAVDARLVLNDAADESNSKTNEAVRQTLRTLKETADYKGTVAIFADNYQNKVSGFNLYEDIKRKLVEQGVPAEQIAIIKSGMTINRKQDIFDKVNSGEIRVVMGSTFTLGTGVNIQERLHTLIHVDAPNRPMDYTQRNGRILRQGNLHRKWDKAVRVLRFGVEDSLDVTAYQRLKTKGAIADSIMNGKKLLEDSMTNRVMEEEEDVFGDTVAQLSGSEYAMLKNQAEKEVRKLEARMKQWEADQIYIHNAEPRLRGQIKADEERAAANKGYLAKVEKDFPGGTFKAIKAGKNTFGNVDEMGDFFKEHNKTIKEAQDKVRDTVGATSVTRNLTLDIDGVKFEVTTTITHGTGRNGASLFSTAERDMTYSCAELGLEDVPVKNGYVKNAVEDIVQNVLTGTDFKERMETAEAAVERNKKELETMLKRKGGTFDGKADLEKAKEKLDEYTEKMKEELAAKEAKYAEMDAEVETATDVVEAEEDSEEANEAAREQRVDEDAVGELTEDEIAIRDAISDHLNSNGIETIIDDVAGQRVMDLGRSVQLSKGQKRALETATLIPEGKADLTVVSSADGAKILQKIDAAIKKYEEKSSNHSKTFIGDVANALEMTSDGSASQYATFETKNGKTVTIRMGNHNATVKNFDVRGESDGISIVIAQYASEGITNNGVAHLVEFYYSEKALRRADGKPLVEILKSIKQSLYSGEYNDTTGLAEREEVNADRIREHRVYHGSGADFEAFDHSHMSEGEGNQAFGWGTYVTEVEGIGKAYAEETSKKATVTYKGLTQEELRKRKDKDNAAIFAIMIHLSGRPRSVEYVKKEEIRRAKRIGMEAEFINTLKSLNPEDFMVFPERHLYMVEIPDDNGENYLGWDTEYNENEVYKIVERFLDAAVDAEKRNDFDEADKYRDIANELAERMDEETASWNPIDETVPAHLTGELIYYYVDTQAKTASQILSKVGYTGIKYAANYLNGGNKEGKKNYVIFNEADAKIVDHVRFFKTAYGEAYGFTVGGKIYIDPRIATAETPIHEYAHLWAEALRQGNPKEWKNVVELMKGTSAWEKVRQKYPELKSDNEIADEVLAHYSGRRGAEWLREEQRSIAQSKMGVTDKAAAISALENVKQALKKFWKAVADFLHIHYTSAEEVADRVLSDLLNGVNPTTLAQENTLFRTSDELTDEYGTRWLDEQTTDDGRHATQVKNTINSYKKFGEWVKRDSEGRDVSVLDASSGLGLGTQWMRENGIKADDVEPYPSENREKPTFGSYAEVNKKYDYIISNAVLNVIPDDWRANVLHDMADKMKDGGKMVINVRGAQSIREQGVEGKTKISLDNPSEILVLRPDGSIRAYQKGFTKPELKEWVERELGNDYTVEVANMKNAGGSYDTAVVVTKTKESNTTNDAASRNGQPTRKGASIVSSSAKLVNKSETSKLLADLSKRIIEEKLGPHELLHEIVKALSGITERGTSTENSKYFDLGGGVTLRVSDHQSNTKTFADRGEHTDNYGLVIKVSPKNATFKPKADVDYLEYVYYPDKLVDGQRQKAIVDGLASFLSNGNYSSLPEPDRVNTSGKFRDAELQREGDTTANTASEQNDPYIKMGADRFTQKQRDDYNARQARRVQTYGRTAAESLAEKLHLKPENFEVLGSEELRTKSEELSDAQKRAKGFFNTRTGKITVVLGNHQSVADVEKTVLHEAVAHYGLRQLFGKQFDTFLDNVYAAANREVRTRIAELAKKHKWNFHTATEEYLAGLAESTDFERAMQSGWWTKIKELFMRMLHSIGFDGYAEKAAWRFSLSDNELRYILWRSYENLAEPGRYRSILGKAADVAKQYELGVGNFTSPGSSDGGERAAEGGLFSYFNGSMAELIAKAKQSAQGLIKKVVAPVSSRLKADLAAKGVEVDDSYKHVIDNNAIRHTLKHHGSQNEVKRGQMPITAADFERIPEIVAEYDSVTVEDGKRGEKNIIYSKTFADGTTLFVEEKRDNRKELAAVTMWKKKKPTLTDANRHDATPISDLSELSDGKVTTNVSDMQASDEDVLFRDGDDLQIREAQARDAYERRVKTSWYQTKEAMQDSMLGLKEGLQAILQAEDGKKNHYMEDIAGFENPYLGENRLSSVNQAEMEAMERLLFKPMYKEVAKLAKGKAAFTELTDYMMAKHGLERNEVMARREAEKEAREEFAKELRKAERAAAKDAADQKAIDELEDVKQRMHEREEELYYEKRGRDYAGLTALMQFDSKEVGLAEAEAQKLVKDYEADHDTTALWKSVNAVNEAILSKQLDGGIISKETYADIKGMYKNYIPLRGFEETTSADKYAYLQQGGQGYNAPIKKAKGRSSKADNPFAYMLSMAESGIMGANRNVLVKQRMLNFALNHPSDLVSVSQLWLKYDDVADEWVAQFPDTINDGDSPAEVEQKVKAFEAHMEQLAEQDPDHYAHGKQTAKIPYRVVEKSEEKQHQVIVKRFGQDYVLTINGNPRMAQALNGKTNPDSGEKKGLAAALRFGEAVNRQLSAFYTTRNPDFMLSNFLRDALYSNTMAWVKESPKYALRFHKNFAAVNPGRMKFLLKRYEKGTLDMNDATDKMYYQFMMNGGETGYTALRDIEQHKKDAKKGVKRAGQKVSVGKGMEAVADFLDEWNRAFENCARFAAFKTSREMGRTIDRCIYDAKEISVNFNKKGSGAKFQGETGQTWVGNTAAFASGAGRASYVFWNAALQGTTNFARQFKRHPAKALAGAASLFLLGAMAAAMGGDGDDDDKNAYYNLPEYVRRSNFMKRVGGQWVSIPLPVEYRLFYGMGELAASVIGGKEHMTDTEIGLAVASQLSQALPLDFLEGGGDWKNVLPSAVKPVAEAASNKSWTGMPIYKDTPYNKEMPEWTKAYKSANKYLVGLSEALNEATGGDKYTSGAVDINPAQVEYLLKGMLGGVATTIDEFVKTGETRLGEREYDPRSFMFLNRLVKNGDERTEFRAINNEYFRLKEEAERTKSRMKHYDEERKNGDEREAYRERYKTLRQSPQYERLRIYERNKKRIDELSDQMKEARTEERMKRLEQRLNERKKRFVNAVEATCEK